MFGEEHLKEAKEKYAESRLKTKKVLVQKKKTDDKSVELGYQILGKQTKSTTKPLFNPTPFKVVEVLGNSVSGKRWKEDKKELQQSEGPKE